MFKPETLLTGLCWVAVAGALLALSLPASGADPVAPEIPVAALPAAAADPCGEASAEEPLFESPLDRALGTNAQPRDIIGPFGRTCRCSCGAAPCETDADCGPGGRCSYAITCCALPQEVGDEANPVAQGG